MECCSCFQDSRLVEGCPMQHVQSWHQTAGPLSYTHPVSLSMSDHRSWSHLLPQLNFTSYHNLQSGVPSRNLIALPVFLFPLTRPKTWLPIAFSHTNLRLSLEFWLSNPKSVLLKTLTGVRRAETVARKIPCQPFSKPVPFCGSS